MNDTSPYHNRIIRDHINQVANTGGIPGDGYNGIMTDYWAGLVLKWAGSYSGIKD